MRGASGLFLGAAMLTAALMAHGCGGGSSGSTSSSSGGTVAASSAFPTSLAVASPFETVTSPAASLNTSKAGSSFVSGYSSITTKISTILSGSSSSVCTFDPASFLAKPGRANCYAPTMTYQDHPDAALPNSGYFPSGDMGIWQETEGSTGEACAAAELNSQMEGLGFQAEAALESVATMICSAKVNGVWPPAAGGTANLLSSSLATPLSAPNVTFSTATISRDATGDVWTYTLNFTYTDTLSAAHGIAVQLSHQNGAASGTNSGRFTYMVNDTFSGGNCPTSDVTANGSLVYATNSATSVNVESRIAYYCGSNAVGIDSSGLVDPSYKYPTYSSGWANNFSIFTASFDPTSLAGSYSYLWQAGPNDSNTRVFDVTVNNTSPMTAEAWFGFGNPVGSSDRCIQGFFCSWAGPGTTHTMSNYAQRQNLTMNTSTGVMEPTNSAASDITYAPTNSCTYDGSGSFIYDRDLNGVLDETASELDVEYPATIGLAFDLYAAQDVNGDGTPTMCETIESRGFTEPSAPAYTNPYTGSHH